MTSFLRKLRALLGVGLTWATIWSVTFTAIALVVALLFPEDTDDTTPARIAWIGAQVGLVSGAVFALLLAVAEPRRSAASLSPWRGALWGALASATMPLLTGVDDRMAMLLCPIGAAVGAATFAIAKRQSGPELLASTSGDPPAVLRASAARQP